MKISVSENLYKKVEFETDNRYTANTFEKYLNKAKLPYDLNRDKDVHTFTAYLTDEQLEWAKESFMTLEEANEGRMKKLRQQYELLSQYFDEVTLLPGCDLQFVMYTNETRSRTAVSLVALNGGTGITWTTVERILRKEAGKGLQKRFDDMNFVEWDIPAEEVYVHAANVQKRLEDCLTAVEDRKKSDTP